MMTSMLGGERVSDECAANLHDRTGGLPLAVEESVRLIWNRAGSGVTAPGAAAPWWLLTGGLLAFAVGDLAHVVQAADGDDRLGSPAEAIYLLGYLSQITGMVLMVRRRTPGRDLASLVDALIVAGAFALPAWVFLIGPLATANLELLGRISAVAMPTLDLTLLVLLAWLLTVGGSRSVTFVLIVISYVRCEGRRRRSGRGR